MKSKTQKHKCKLKYVTESKLNKLYAGINENCINCKYDCKNECDLKCNDKRYRESVNEIIDLLKENNVNLLRLCEDYGLKLNILLEMLQGNMILNYKYYTVINSRIEEYDSWTPYLEGVDA